MILVFGSGQLGQDLVRASAARQVPLVALERAQADISDPAAVRAAIAQHRPDLVVNAAAYTKVDQAESEAHTAFRVNADGAGIIGAACAGIPFIHISTDYVFDGTKSSPYLEDDPVAPLNVYGQSKAAGERAVRETNPHHVIVRSSWIFGEFGHNFLKTMLRLAATRDELRVVADQHGSPTSTRDLSAALLTIAPRLIAGEDVWGTYHFTATGTTTFHGFASRIVAAQAPLTGRTPRVTAITTAEFPSPARRPGNSQLDCGRFERVFGFRGRPWTEETDAITSALVTSRIGSAQHVA